MILTQTAHLADIPQSSLESLPTLPLKSDAIEEGRYQIKSPSAKSISSDSDVIQESLWFKSPVCLF
jgi:hypothetical protein